ncbi:hypothetical protein ZIOFF_038835 [Zingiber officinale]|uniref:Polyprotein n=1 Tax=Zingiber officinale TaxID=94328 RepID=A0A8J5G6B7_ZINOF|nr:hypothetical protein ZIOFF_038835 [Zingiber officinale]
MVLIVLKDSRWQGDRSIIATMEVDLTHGTQMIYVIPDLMMNIHDFANYVELSIQTHGYEEWQGGSSNLLVTRMMVGRLTNTSFTNFAYNVQNVVDYLASRGVIALPGTEFTAGELQQHRWILRPSTRRNPVAPTRVQTRTLLDSSVSMQFQRYTPTLEDREVQSTNHEDVEITSPENEILAMLREEYPEALYVTKINPDAIIPERRTAGVAGYDLTLNHTYIIEASERELILTGLAFAIQEGQELLTATSEIKAQVQQLPDLEIPPEQTYIILETDGSMMGWGGVCKWKLKKADPRSMEKVCTYAHGKFPTVKSVIDAEIFAAMETMSALKIHFLDKVDITLRTDCQVIISFHNKSIKNKPSRVRWIAFTDFITGTGVKVNFEHIDDKLNIFADNLSRLIEDQEMVAVLTEEVRGGGGGGPPPIPLTNRI